MCPHRDELAGYVFGTLQEDQAETIGAHVEACPACEDTVRDLETAGDEVLAKLRQPSPKDTFVNEPGCRQVLQLIEAIGRDPSFTQLGLGRPAIADESLGQVRVYRLLAKLGQGGMGTVYKALHTELDKIVALKVLPTDRLQDRAAVDRFKREMKAIGKLEHPNLVRAMDAGEDGGTHYLVMELVDGSNVSDLVKRWGPLPLAEACEIIRQAALGLQYAHEHGLVHRDIKPSNLMLSGTSAIRNPQSAMVKVLDLGLALVAGQQVGADDLTATGQIMGTVDYMAPEQAGDTHRVDIRADIYSLGATLYKLLTTRAPFEGQQYNTTIKKLTALATAAPQDLRVVRPNVPVELAEIIQRLLSKSPDQRPATPAEVADLLAPFASGAQLARLLDAKSLPAPTQAETSTTTLLATADTNPQADQPAPATTPRVSPSRNWRWLWAAAAALVVLAGTIVIATKQGTVTITQPAEIRDDVKIVLSSGGDEVAILDKSNHWTVTVRNGQYDLGLRGGNDEFQIRGDKLTVKRFGQTLVEVENKPADTDPDRRAAEWVLSVGGSVRIFDIRDVSVATDLPTDRFSITTASIKNMAASNAGLENLIGLKKLKQLYFNGRTVTDDRLTHLNELTTLKRLYLHLTRVTDSGLSQVKDLKQLDLLVLDGNPITDLGLAQLEGLSQLTTLDVQRTRVTEAGLAAFHAAVPECRIVHDGGVIEPSRSTGADRRVAEWLLSIGAYVRVDPKGVLTGTWITQAADLPQGNWRLTSVTRCDPRVSNDNLLSRLVEAEEIQFLDVSGSAVTDAGIEHLKRLKHLSDLLIHDTALSDVGLAQLKTMTSLKELDLRRTQVTAKGVAGLKQALPECRVRWTPQWQPTAEQQAFIEAVAQLPAEEQVDAVKAKLKAIHYKYDGQAESELQQGKVARFELHSSAIREIWPVAGLSKLKELSISGTAVEDLRPLTALADLQSLDCSKTTVADLSPVTLFDFLERLDCSDTRVRDLSAIEGMLSLKELRTFAVTPYNERAVAAIKRTSKSPIINGIPLAEFLARRDEVEQLKKSLPAFPPQKQVELVVAMLKRFNPDFKESMASAGFEKNHVARFLFSSVFASDLSPVRAFPNLTKLEGSYGYPAISGKSRLADLSPLTGMRLTWLVCGTSQVYDLSPLQGMPLEFLSCGATPVDDLSPLAGMPLKQLMCGGCGISDLTPLTGMPLEQLLCNGTQVADISPLLGLSRLRDLNLIRTRVPSPAIAQLMQALPQCKVLYTPLWQPTAQQREFVEAVARLPADQQVDAVVTKLKAINPKYAGPVERQRVVKRLELNDVAIREIWPVAGLTWLQELSIANTSVEDLMPLTPLIELRSLDCSKSAVRSLDPVASFNYLERLDCSDTAVRDLSPLDTLRYLKELRTFAVSPYNAAAVEIFSRISKELSINGIPLAEFLARRDEVEQLKKTLPAFPPEKQVEMVVAMLKKFNPGFQDSMADALIEKNRVVRLRFRSQMATDLSPVRAFPNLSSLETSYQEPPGTPRSRLADLSPLAGMALTQFVCGNSYVGDLSPLRGMPLEHLTCVVSLVDDLSPLEGMPLTKLDCRQSQIVDLSPLRKSPVQRLICHSTPVADLTPLKECSQLTELVVYKTRVTAAGIAELQQALPQCKIVTEAPSGQ